MSIEAVQKIACRNEAGFVMNFSIGYIDGDGRTQHSPKNSGNYPLAQTRTIDLSEAGINPEDAILLWPYVHAILGKHENGEPKVKYARNGKTAVYKVKGTTLDFSVKLDHILVPTESTIEKLENALEAELANV